MENKELTVSVIVPTYNGAGKISSLLGALSLQSTMPAQVIVSIDGSTDNTRALVEPYRIIFPGLILLENANQGRARARNCAVPHATGDLLVFYDDDMEPAPDSLARHIQFHTQHKGLLSGNAVEFQSPEKADVQNYKAHMTKFWASRFTEGIQQLDERNLFFTSANCSMRKTDFFQLRGFSDLLSDAEDYELALRALRAGYSVYFDMANQAIHHDNITCNSYIQRIRQYEVAHKQLYMLYPDLHRSLTSRSGFRRVVYKLFAFPRLVTLVDREWFRWLPRFLRYKVYGVIIHALGIEYPHIELPKKL